MLLFILRRLAQTCIVLVILSMIVFSFIHLMPGDPVVLMLGNEASPEQMDLLRKELGLDKPLVIQYSHWLFNLLKGDLGKSIIYREDVAELIANRLPVTFHVGIVALFISIAIGIPLGVIAAVKRGSFIDSIITVTANFGLAVPTFWLGILGIYFFSLKLGLLPVQGYTSPFDDFWLSTKQIIMPSVFLATTALASFARQTRSAMLEVIRQDYVRTARSKGLKESVVITKHAFKNAIIPIITLIGLQIRNLVGGSVLIETVFNIPGMGSLLVKSVFDQDIVVVQSSIIIIAIVVAIANLTVDILYGYFDPRIRIQ